MSQKNDNGKVDFSEISTIRNILMGEHISEFQSAFKSLESNLEEIKSDFEQKLKNAKDNYDSRLEEMQKTHDTELKALKTELLEKNQLLEQKVDKNSDSSKKRLSLLFANLSEAVTKG